MIGHGTSQLWFVVQDVTETYFLPGGNAISDDFNKIMTLILVQHAGGAESHNASLRRFGRSFPHAESSRLVQWAVSYTPPFA